MNKDVLRGECERVNRLLNTKNDKYGDSFYKSLDKHGNSAFLVRLEDKFCRMENLIKTGDKGTADESLEDTITDMAGYCLLYLAYRIERSLNQIERESLYNE